jgi:organic radical activating enzyme
MQLQVNTQTPETVVVSDGLHLEVIGKPWITVQGEGPLAGEPAVFVRLAGCTLKCPGCDTNYTEGRGVLDTDELVGQVISLVNQMSWKWTGKGKTRPLVVLTGGEPFRQNVSEFVLQMTTTFNCRVQIETNGREPPQGIIADVWNPNLIVVVSPKLTVHPVIWKIAQTAKYVLESSAVNPVDGLPTSALGYKSQPDRPPTGWPGKIYVQPMDENNDHNNKVNVLACIESAQKFGYTVSLQTHKILGVP